MNRCSVKGCEGRKYYAKGYCKFHYARWWMYGDPLTYKFRTATEKFWDRVQKREPDQCWLWKGGSANGYGQLAGKHNGEYKSFLAHRFSYELHYGPIPSGKLIRHHCDNPVCVNPRHLAVGTHADNVADMVTRGRARGRGSAVDKTITCGHPEREFCAKGMCVRCYKKSWLDKRPGNKS